MTSAHLLYIPTIFLLGFLTGTLFPHKPETSPAKSTVSGKSLILSLVVFMVVFIGTHSFPIPRSSKAVTLALDGAELFDREPSYTSEEVYNRIDAFPQAGIYLYQEFTYTIDVLFPVTLLALLMLLARYTTDRIKIPSALKMAATWLPITWFASDMVENTVIYNLLKQYPMKLEFLAGSLGYITTVKFALLVLSILTPALALVRRRLSGTVSKTSRQLQK